MASAMNGGEEGTFEMEPASAAVLADLEQERRDEVGRKGKCGIGCREVDECVLLGGLERGAVVGISSDEDFGVLVSLQLIAKTLCDSLERGKRERALVVSTQPTGMVVRMLRDAVAGQIGGGKRVVSNGVVKEILGQVSIVRVFDLTGLAEVLGELDVASLPGPEREEEEVEKKEEPEEPEAERGQGGRGREEIPDSDEEAEEQEQEQEQGGRMRDEIPDSDEDMSTSPSPAAPAPAPVPTKQTPTKQSIPDQGPDIILVTHFSTLLTTLFTHTEKTSAHNTLQLLSSRLRHLSRTLPSSPLVILANSTTTTAAHSGPATEARDAALPPGGYPPRRQEPDPTLRSVFAAPGPYAGGTRQKPSFGRVFAQLLDLHVLCTRVPRTREDAEGFVLGRGGDEVWAVEVLLDEGGVWEGKRGERKGRERRWGIVDLEGGRIIDAFRG
ncbi:related to PET191 protein, involved in assembly of cytochrome oxidase [Cephalotrichum gorgonifer]|uniref:Related to PET191 protein, involved in assembly of cytochrome oxidase n=1 Tax=Cephalotrichum gorgonifer TaxID=2041049 RepID=A0AAE8MST9_9PEZI|nr:related to PET191 protein, involved in assembly of cytochrome oxidase [Cephalotrichum gorgonifer]